MELVQFSNLHSTKLGSGFLISLFFFSVLFSYSSLVPIIFNFMQFFSRSVDKNHMFLLCNGILALIVKTAGHIGNSYQDTDSHCESTLKYGGRAQKAVELSAIKAAVPAENFVVEDKQVPETKDKALVVAGDERENALLITKDVGDEQGDELVVVDHEDDDEEQEEDAIGLLSAEELNIKCDDFIRRMKEGIKFEAEQLNTYSILTLR